MLITKIYLNQSVARVWMQDAAAPSVAAALSGPSYINLYTSHDVHHMTYIFGYLLQYPCNAEGHSDKYCKNHNKHINFTLDRSLDKC